jgi:hypothetical protein
MIAAVTIPGHNRQTLLVGEVGVVLCKIWHRQWVEAMDVGNVDLLVRYCARFLLEQRKLATLRRLSSWGDSQP